MIIHKGIVSEAGHDTIKVVVTAADDCGKCAIANLCNKQETIEVPYPGAGPALVGREAEIGVSAGMQTKATVLFFAMPVVILLATLAASMACGATEGTAALISIGAVAAWYMLLYLMRVNINRRAVFRVIRIGQ